MTINEKIFWKILTDLFIGAEAKEKSSFANFMSAKSAYFKSINDIYKDNEYSKDEIYDKLYSFFIGILVNSEVHAITMHCFL